MIALVGFAPVSGQQVQEANRLTAAIADTLDRIVDATGYLDGAAMSALPARRARRGLQVSIIALGTADIRRHLTVLQAEITALVDALKTSPPRSTSGRDPLLRPYMNLGGRG